VKINVNDCQKTRLTDIFKMETDFSGQGQTSGVFIDGRQLAFPGTGLAMATAEILRALAQSSAGRKLCVFVENNFLPEVFELENEPIVWVPIAHVRCKPDYLERLTWAHAVKQHLRSSYEDWPLFIPYLYNYGRVRTNIVFIPDLVYRIFPDYGERDSSKPWWNLRGRLPFRPLVRRWEECRAASAYRVLVYSEFVRQQVHEILHVPLERIEVVSLAAPRWVTETALQQKPVCRLPARYALYTGGYAVRKNVPLLLRACGRIYQIDPSFRCVFVGLNEQHLAGSNEMRAAWQLKGVSASVVLTPRLTNNEIGWCYHKCEFALYPSHSEGFGLPVIEAGVCGKLCLCGDNSSLREVQPNYAYRIRSEDEDKWVERILHFWKNREDAALAGEECRQSTQRYSWQLTAKKLWHLFTTEAT
jgi:glycosyltransferase involved in cell wall biosynthesis